MNESIIQKAEDFVTNLLSNNTLQNIVYHSIDHTHEVVNAVENISAASNLKNEEFEIVVLAAWFHDLGYLEKIDGHEEVSARYAEEFLAEESYPTENIIKIKNCILATKVPQSPKNILKK
jgi:predicted metal-dependent HD superfamily phosphohydrolase